MYACMHVCLDRVCMHLYACSTIGEHYLSSNSALFCRQIFVFGGRAPDGKERECELYILNTSELMANTIRKNDDDHTIKQCRNRL